MDKIRLSQAVIVEGKYDKIKLSAFIDAVIITTEGFGIFKDKETTELIRKYAASTGIIVLTDSDAAGFRIRGHIKSICPNGKITNIYIPDIYGKEQRKTEPSKEGKLGVEGIDVQLLRRLFEASGAIKPDAPASNEITMQDFYELGLTGAPHSSELRRSTAVLLGLPERLMPKALLEAANSFIGRKDFFAAVEKAKKEMGI